MMKKFGLLIFLIVCVGKFSSAQTINISGSVKTSDGDALHLAFVQDKQYKYATYTDSLGNFTLTVNPNSKLYVSCNGFKSKLINIDNKTAFSIVLQPIVNIVASQSGIPATVDENSNINEATFRDMMMLDQPKLAFQNGPTLEHPMGNPTVDMAQGAIFPVFSHSEATAGSRFFLKDWPHGFVLNMKDSIIQSPGWFLNYDKIGGSLLLTRDKRTILEVNSVLIKSFTLIDDLNKQYTFTIVPAIDKTHFVQVIAVGSYYIICKLIQTKFIKANYQSDGVMSSGNHYDEYTDENTYYIIGKNGIPQKIALKKKSIKLAFNDDAVKLNQFFATNDRDVDDNYLHDLGDYMNK